MLRQRRLARVLGAHGLVRQAVLVAALGLRPLDALGPRAPPLLLGEGPGAAPSPVEVARAAAAGLASMLFGGGGSDGGLGDGDFTCLRNSPLRVRSGVALRLSLNLAGSGENGLRGVGSPSACSARHARRSRCSVVDAGTA